MKTIDRITNRIILAPTITKVVAVIFFTLCAWLSAQTPHFIFQNILAPLFALIPPIVILTFFMKETNNGDK